MATRFIVMLWASVLFTAMGHAQVSIPAPTHTVSLSWTAGANGAAATGFNVYKAPATGTTCPAVGVGAFLKIASTTTATAYVDTNASPSTSLLTEGSTYCYEVTATNAGGESPGSNIASATVPFSVPTAPVLNPPVVK